MINIQEYFEKHAHAGDIATTTNYGVLPRIIYRKTWGKKNGKLVPYKKRAHLGTHVAIVIKYQDAWYFVEMDTTKTQHRYIHKSHVDNKILTTEEFKATGKPEEEFDIYHIISGVKITPWHEYATDQMRSPHICWIGRHPDVIKVEEAMNAWYIDRYRNGVQYDFPDIIITFLKINKRLGVKGSEHEFICSELPEVAFQAFNIRLRNHDKPWSPMDWQLDPKMQTITKMS